MSNHVRCLGIVVGVDGSRSARAAVRWATREAMMRNVPLTLVHAAPMPMAGSDASAWASMVNPVDYRAWHEETYQMVFADVLDDVEGIAGNDDPPKIDRRLFVSSPVSKLVDLSKKAQMMVVGYSCRQGVLHNGLLGSVSTGLIHHAHCPVAVIHEKVPLSRPFCELPVLVGVDGSRASELATAIAFDEASWRGVDLVALHAWSDAEMSSDVQMSAVRKIGWADFQSRGEEVMAERLAGFRERYPDVSVRRLVVWEQPAHHLIGQSESAQLVVVGSHASGGLAETPHRSVSTAVVHAARIPVIVARQPCPADSTLVRC